MEAVINLLPKQSEAWDAWESPEITELGYGGAAGGGKSRLGCYLAITIAEMHPGSRCAIGRKELKTLRLTTLSTMFEILAELGYKEGHYKYDAQQGLITFPNKSQILLLDTAYSPQDPEYTRFGSLEITWAWIDESNETPEKAKSILKTRVGRKNNLNGKEVKAFWLETFNPNKGHVYRDYYQPWKDGTLPSYRAFIRALPGDNPYLPSAYILNLERSDKVTRERLLKGNFEFDDNPQKIMFYEAICDLTRNTLVNNSPIKTIIADIARFGGDKIVIGTFKGLELYALGVYTYQGIDKTIEQIRDEALAEGVGFQNILVDEGGVGGGVVDGMRGIKGFNGALGEMVNDRKISVKIDKFRTNIEGYTLEKAISDIIEELDVIQKVDDSANTKLAIIPKSEIKEILGRSPDFADIFMMRMFFELKDTPKFIKEVAYDIEEKETNNAI